RSLPFEPESFDAIISIDAFEYFGTDVHLLPALLKVLKPGGYIGMSTPALRTDPYEVGLPPAVFELWAHEAAAFHSPEWWRRHWELSGLVDDIRARWQEGGRDSWLLWERALAAARGESSNATIELLERDRDEQLGFTLISARKR